MNNPGGPFSFMPMPFGFNPFAALQQQQQVQSPVTHGPPPARVRVALEFLTDLTVKGMTRAAANDISIELIPGQKLSMDEVEAQKAACACLKEYFAGRTRPDRYEQIAQKKIETRTLANGKPGMILQCIGCAAMPNKMPYCKVCHGTGEIMVFPTVKSNEE